MPRNSMNVSTKQERIAELAKRSPQMAFTSLAYLMDIDWLKEAYRRTRKDGAAGVDGVTAEDGSVSYPEAGAPQGGVASPLLSNVFLHYVLDLWFERDVKPRLRQRAFLVRYADDCAPRRRDGPSTGLEPERHAA